MAAAKRARTTWERARAFALGLPGAVEESRRAIATKRLITELDAELDVAPRR
ncbi:hypothetical protein ACFVT5_33100 [Streptomyces sp. NPDC058001]|uniref:hypothetical protein n=1 Tax=Streptomyces sp. NPDC058001 TaxID=3346300 RepID=UPI0036E0AE1D